MNQSSQDTEMLKMMDGEDKLFDLQKEHFHNVRTMITASAAIASVDLLALAALQEFGIGNWFLGSVVLLYLASILYVIYLTYTNNAQAKMFVERSGYTKTISEMMNNPDMNKIEALQAFTLQVNSSIQSVTKRTANLKKARILLLLGNILFIVGLCIPIVGFVISLFL